MGRRGVLVLPFKKIGIRILCLLAKGFDLEQLAIQASQCWKMMLEAFLLQNSHCLFSQLEIKLLIQLQVQITSLHRYI